MCSRKNSQFAAVCSSACIKINIRQHRNAELLCSPARVGSTWRLVDELAINRQMEGNLGNMVERYKAWLIIYTAKL